MEKPFVIKDMVKKYPGFQLGPLNLEMEQGTVLGYIGRNGAGKSTTMHCMVGLLKFDQGEINIYGKPNDPIQNEWKQKIGYVGDYHVFYEKWSAEKNLKFKSRFYPAWSDKKTRELIKRFRLPVNKRAKDLSSGNRVKLSLISVLAYSPKLLILDEPTAGLDPLVRDEVLEELFEVLEDGERAIFYSTHILSDIKRLVDNLIFLDEGEIFLETSKEDLLEKWRQITFHLTQEDISLEAIASRKKKGNEYQVISHNFEKTLSQIKRLGATNIVMNRMGIDEISVQVIKRGKDVAIG
jgi:ABC-2 type transport system ATP-binding protein